MSTWSRVFIVAIILLFDIMTATRTQARAEQQQMDSTAPTFTVFATRQGLVGHRTANGHIIQPRDRFVALPSWKALSSRGGNEFQVRVTYGDRSVVLPVWDVGPWNTNDDYWSPERRYSDLPQGKPMAQAAYEDGYNGGRDEFGRRIRSPNGIDIADGAFWDDLGMRGSGQVEVTFLWLGEDTDTSITQQNPADEQITIEPGAKVVDDVGEGYNAEAAITWYDHACGMNGGHTWTYGTDDPALSENRAQWKPRLTEAGLYEVFAYIPACGERATTAARYSITHDGATTEVTIDQRAATGSWASLGVYHAGHNQAMVALSDVTGDKGAAVQFDAIKWVLRSDTTPPNAQIVEAKKQEDGSILVRWSGGDDMSGVASYDVQTRKLPDGEWADWLIGTTALEMVFVPPEPGSHAFRVRAVDWTGNAQPWHEEDQAVVYIE